MPPEVTVITVTRRFPSAEYRDSLLRQEFPNSFDHLVIVDGRKDIFVAWRKWFPASNVRLEERSQEDRDGPLRLGYLRELATSEVVTPFVVFLDDDNEWAEDHLSSLWELVSTAGADVAHSQRLLVNSDASPYLKQEFPWGRKRSHRRAVYREYVSLGVFAPGSNRMCDRTNLPYSKIDLGEWLLPRQLAEGSFHVTGSLAEWEAVVVEDHPLAAAIEGSGLEIRSTFKPSLIYRLGGYSNALLPTASIRWERPS